MARHTWVSVREAAKRLGVSESSVRRMVEAGKLIGEREALGGSRERFRVRLPDDETRLDASDSESEDGVNPRQDASAFTNTMDNLIAELSHAQRVSDQRAERIAELERENGNLEFASKHLLAQLDKTEAEARALRERAERPWWRRVWG